MLPVKSSPSRRLPFIGIDVREADLALAWQDSVDTYLALIVEHALPNGLVGQLICAFSVLAVSGEKALRIIGAFDVDRYGEGIHAQGPVDTSSHEYSNMWRIEFDDSGNIVTGDKRNHWIYIHNSSSEDLYTPTKSQVIDKPSKTRQTASNPLDIGNKVVGTEVVDAGILKLRKTFQ